MGHLAKVPAFLRLFLLTGALTLAVACEGEESPFLIPDEKGASLEVEGEAGGIVTLYRVVDFPPDKATSEGLFLGLIEGTSAMELPWTVASEGNGRYRVQVLVRMPPSPGVAARGVLRGRLTSSTGERWSVEVPVELTAMPGGLRSVDVAALLILLILWGAAEATILMSPKAYDVSSWQEPES